MAKGHRSQIKRERNEQQKDRRAQAHAKFVRVSNTKAKIVLDQIKGKSIGEAMGILAYSPRYAAEIIEKVLKSAVANAENNLELDVEDLYIEDAVANQGPTLKRIRPRAQGRAYRINKRTAHISIYLNER
ncbi:MAG: 50S ribosomal protein L22 [Clostridiales bacterium]|jgi:large subunit ribosomal protein L22|nr:50S ribosomal protein L22 [Clostridiales bacterium]